MTGHASRASTAKTTFPLPSAAPAPVSRQCLDDLQAPALLAAGWRIAPDGALRGGVRHGDGHRGRAPGMGERYPDRLGAVFAGVLDRVGDQFGRDDLGVVRVLAQPVQAERGPDTPPRYRH